ncbi:HET-domain-containing protein [Hyaloscypha hepaticicola]|uniref:HET-domain-containing protein n=1 Tax=Hyaloscypha hepaticicola TaxID=2082293 RepID=A0A2J6PPY9_9HELO|nr:HET-domain-containing protein [Hyaloscypha hepaticicola]
MKLINTSTLELHDFYLADIPPYAILSHTWSDGEVNFQEMSSKTCSSKKGFAKIAKTCQIALADGLEYAWVDTCCIDKLSSAKLSEAINSMYQWYAKAALCYVYLEDLPADKTLELAEKALPSCRWFTRGWTLQELLAPKTPSNVRFYDKKWFFRGSKVNFVSAISKCTRVPEGVLTGAHAAFQPSYPAVKIGLGRKGCLFAVGRIGREG